MKPKYSLPIFLLLAFIITGCSSSKKVTGVWVNEKKPAQPYTSMFVVALTLDPEARVAIENSVARIATARGFRVIKSIDSIFIDLKNLRMVTKEEIMSEVKENNIETVFITRVLKQDESIKYTPGATSYSPTTYYSWIGYWTTLEPVTLSSDYYSLDKTYFMQTNLFDVKTEELMWSAQSDIFAPTSLQSFCRSYTSTLMDQLKKAGAIKK